MFGTNALKLPASIVNIRVVVAVSVLIENGLGLFFGVDRFSKSD
jgi:hypothetical protein|tara:strand:+ start:4421 stop:4552 length:132 start_codon:yes stop_codon:yes gene_type:complete